jgi:hypothetical protein
LNPTGGATADPPPWYTPFLWLVGRWGSVASRRIASHRNGRISSGFFAYLNKEKRQGHPDGQTERVKQQAAAASKQAESKMGCSASTAAKAAVVNEASPRDLSSRASSQQKSLVLGGGGTFPGAATTTTTAATTIDDRWECELYPGVTHTRRIVRSCNDGVALVTHPMSSLPSSFVAC